MNIIVSSWPAAGGTTIAILLSYMLGLKYVYAGSVSRYLAAHLADNDLVKLFKKYGVEWDTLWESYREQILAQDSGMLLEGMTAGFLQQDKTNVYSIMISAELETRARRLVAEGRVESVEQMKDRQQEDEDRWYKQFGFKFYDVNDINQHYSLHIDNTKLTIEETLEIIFNALAQEDYFSDKYFFPDLVKQIDSTVKEYWEQGKDHFRTNLSAKNLIIQPEQVIKSWVELDIIKQIDDDKLELINFVNSVAKS